MTKVPLYITRTSEDEGQKMQDMAGEDSRYRLFPEHQNQEPEFKQWEREQPLQKDVPDDNPGLS